jgi:hypothetical protein
VAEIISLDAKLQDAINKKHELTRRRKLLAVKKVFQCTHCSFKCEKCGTQITETESKSDSYTNLRVPYRFCESCKEEYVDYIDRLQGEGDEDCYWHNDEWADTWQKWIEYQGAIDRYTKSKDFLNLIKELKQTRPEE